MNNNLLLIFTRNPELGKVKSRLAKTVGNEKALEIYKFLLAHTKKVTQKLSCDKAVFYSVKVRENDIWDANHYQKFAQSGDDLGRRMHNAFDQSFKNGYQKVIIIGSDLYDLQEQHIEEAFNALNDNDIVIGPAEDGGYYLLGMKTLHPKIFENKEWGTSSVRKDTLNDLQELKIHQTQMLNDIDYYEDIEKHLELSKLFKI